MDNAGLRSQPPSREELLAGICELCETLLALSTGGEERSFAEFERQVHVRLLDLGRLLLTLFLCQQQWRWVSKSPRGGRVEARNLLTLFGPIRYWHTRLRLAAAPGEPRVSYYPLDAELGLTRDRLSFNVLSLASRLATHVSYATARAMLTWFLLKAPAVTVIERTVIGLGRYTEKWFEEAAPPEGDGEVLIVQIDSKAIPTATDSELARRRQKRRRRKRSLSRRHRGRHRRSRYPSKPRRKKGDKSKNGKAGTLIVLYTLVREGKHLLGPTNVRIYASFRSKQHAFEIARREANKRGFTPESGKQVQIVSDGDESFACHARTLFPEAEHTVDVVHVIEKLWKVGTCFHREGSKELAAWIDQQKQLLYGGKVNDILVTLRRRLMEIPLTGPGSKGKRTKLTEVLTYLEKRVGQMQYRRLRARDLEVSSGMVEGAIKHVIGARFDHGGMRWIRDRAEPLLHLRCIEINGDWERFSAWVHDTMRASALANHRNQPLQQSIPLPVPALKDKGAKRQAA